MAATKSGKQALLPPRGPFPCMRPSYGDFGPRAGVPRPKNGQRQRHQRTSSESFLIEEQPSWFEELLDEPETPVKRGGHRRSSSDSFACLELVKGFDHAAAYYAEPEMMQNRGWESALSILGYPGSLQAVKERSVNPGRDADGSEDWEEGSRDWNVSEGGKEGSFAKQAQSETDPTRVKQKNAIRISTGIIMLGARLACCSTRQFAQRSRVRKLQYIAELERDVQEIQAEGLEVSAELKFLDQQYLILNLENKTLKQRLDSLAQEQLIKRFQQESLEREVARLKSLYQQQVQKQHLPPPVHRRSSSRDLDSQFANLSLKHKDASSARDPVNGLLHI